MPSDPLLSTGLRCSHPFSDGFTGLGKSDQLRLGLPEQSIRSYTCQYLYRRRYRYLLYTRSSCLSSCLSPSLRQFRREILKCRFRFDKAADMSLNQKTDSSSHQKASVGTVGLTGVVPRNVIPFSSPPGVQPPNRPQHPGSKLSASRSGAIHTSKREFFLQDWPQEAS